MSTNSSFIKIGVVGKPSAGKSTFLNSVTEANAKTGNYPFTTIEPNHGVALYKSKLPCPCSEFNMCQYCSPAYGKCLNGVRYIPVDIMDVAGLVPGASLGKGLGNKFLDDLRHAQVLIHVLDVSGTTNQKGENCEGYDPIGDIEWLTKEIHDWIFNNLWSRWDSIVRKHKTCKNTIDETFSTQLSGYGCNRKFIRNFCDTLAKEMPSLLEQSTDSNSSSNNLNHEEIIFSKHLKPLEKWSEEDLHTCVDLFLKVRFPTLYVLNKIDHKASSKYINKFFERYDPDRIVLTSALSECFLKKMKKNGYILYNEGDSSFKTLEDCETDEERKLLKPLKDDKNITLLNNVRDMVLGRYYSTGVYEAIAKAVELQDPVIIYPVKYSVPQLSEQLQNRQDTNVKVFEQVALMRYGSSIKGFVQKFYRSTFSNQQENNKHQQEKTNVPSYYVEGLDGRKIAEHTLLKRDENNIVRIVFTGH
ncbi:hypothetical protein ABK040_004112 [Willaertia magna]